MEHTEFTREIYWNVGHGITTLGPMYFLFLIALAFIGHSFYRRFIVYKQGLPLQRTDKIGVRTKGMLINVVLQNRVRRGGGGGLFHALFFWGFFLLLIGTTLIVIQADFTDLFFDLTFLKGKFYLLFSFVLDLAGLVSICMLVGLITRRYWIKPKGLETSKDDAVMHLLLMAIFLTGFVIEGARMAVTEQGTSLALWSPVGNIIAGWFAGFTENTLRLVHKATWWFHLILVMGFLALIPRIKFKHILTTSANSFFRDLGPTGKLVSLELDDDDAENFGASQIEHLSWKDIFDTDACTLCKRCQDQCPAYATAKPLSPMKVVNQLGETAYGAPEANLLDIIGRDVLWSCTTCRACQDICPASIEHVNKIVEMRRSLVLMEGDFPGEEVMAAMEHTEVNGNPLGIGYASRGDWAEGLDILSVSDNQQVDVLYFVGCYGSFDKRNISVARSFIKLCNAAGQKVAILEKGEKCCGEPMRKMGNEYLYQTLAMENIEAINGAKIKTVVTTCPHCYNTLEKDYRDLGLEAEVVSYTVYLDMLVASGALQLRPREFTCTYHDSCYLGRYNDVYSAPRSLIKAAGGSIIEMEKCLDQSFCCGAGGGRVLAEETIGERINVTRVKMAERTGSEALVSNCPFCLTMFEDGVKGAELDDRLVPRDIAEILVERL